MATKNSIMNGWKVELAEAAKIASQAIADAVKDASRTIADAASEAKKTVASAAGNAAQVVSVQASNDAARVADFARSDLTRNTADHELLSTISTELRLFVKEDKEWKNETSKRNENVHADHETRIRENEKNITRIMTWGSALVFLVGILEVVLTKFWK